jgi:uncharacterized membrane protein (GlpM family)
VLALLVRFALGATVVGLALWISDNVDARVGGVVSAVPKTSAVSLFVIAYEHGGAFAAETAVSSLFGIAAVIVYATALALLLARGPDHPWGALAGGLAAYAAIVGPYLWAGAGLALGLNLGLVGLAYAFSVLAVRRVRAAQPGLSSRSPGVAGGPVLRYGVPALVGGSLVLAATLAADLLGPVWGGIASVFPANVTTIVVGGALVLDPQAAFDQAASVPDGVAAAGAFLLGLHLLLPRLPLVAAGLLAYLAWGGVAWALSTARAARPVPDPV